MKRYINEPISKNQFNKWRKERQIKYSSKYKEIAFTKVNENKLSGIGILSVSNDLAIASVVKEKGLSEQAVLFLYDKLARVAKIFGFKQIKADPEIDIDLKKVAYQMDSESWIRNL